MRVKVRSYDASCDGKDSALIRKVAEANKKADYSKIEPKKGFVIESSEANRKYTIGFIMYNTVKSVSFGNASPEIKSLTHSFQKLNVLDDDDQKCDDQVCDEKSQNDQQKLDDAKCKTVQITHFFIASAHRGQGIGASLLQHLICSFAQNIKFEVSVAANNHIAINCFHKCGFQIKYQIKDYFGKSQNGLKMTFVSKHTILSRQIVKEQLDIAKYTVRFAQNNDIGGIKKILYDVWPNQRDWGYPDDPITIVIEELFHGKRQIVGFAHCSLTLIDRHKDSFREIADYYDCDAMLEYNEYFAENKLEWYKLRDHMLHIQQFAIDKMHRHKGFGSLLLKYIIRLFPENTMFALEVEANNLNAIRLYKKNGFRVKRRKKNLYGKDRDGYKMIFISDHSMEESVEYLAENQIVYKAKGDAMSSAMGDIKSKIKMLNDDDDEKEDRCNAL